MGPMSRGMVVLLLVLLCSTVLRAEGEAPTWMKASFEAAVEAGILARNEIETPSNGPMTRMQAAVLCNRLLLAKASGTTLAMPLRRDLLRMSRDLAGELAVLSSMLSGFERRMEGLEQRLKAVEVERCELVEPESGKVVCATAPAVPDGTKATGGSVATAPLAKEALPPSQQGYPFPLKPVLARKNDNIRIGGIYKWWWRHQDSAVGDEMAARNARLYVYGDVSPDVRFTYQLDTSADYSAADGKIVHAPTLRDGKLLFNLDRANPWRTDVQIGRFIPRLYRYHPVAIDTIDFVYYPRFQTGSSNLAVWRQSGMEFRHRNRDRRYTLGFANGSAPNEDAWSGEDNNSKDFWARYELGEDKKPWFGGVTLWKGKADLVKDDRIRKGLFLQRRDDELRALFEIVWADDEEAGLPIDRKGYVLQAIYEPKKSRFEWLARYDFWDKDEAIAGNEDRWLTLGLNYFIAGRKTYFSLNWIDKRNDAATTPRDEELVGQCTLVF